MATTVFGTTIAVFPPMTPLLESLRLLDSQAFEQCFHRWVESITLAIGAQVIPIDGKTVRQSFDRERRQKAIHVISARATRT